MSRKLALIPLGILTIIVVLTLIFPSIPAAVYAGPEINSGDTAWMITATALVLFMTPGLAFFMEVWFGRKCNLYHGTKLYIHGCNHDLVVCSRI